jgi:myo-inositol-1-phosphate synthase
MSKTGVWIIGARGGVATTALVGALALREGLTSETGLITSTALFEGVPLTAVGDLVFGGHDIRSTPLPDCAREIAAATGTFPPALLDRLEAPLRAIDGNVRPGVLFRSGDAIDSIADEEAVPRATEPAATIERIAADLREFRAANGLERLVVVNLASTEPRPPAHPAHEDASALDSALRNDDPEPFIASSLYALAAAEVGAAFLNFTPSPGALLPSIAARLRAAGVPFAGSDGKTGETLVKSALAPMFRYRNLKVLSWQGYNMLGDRDGQVLAHEENRAAKVESKDNLLHESLGYPLHSKVSIDYVPSLDDWKTAWDFIHFEGFLGVRMSLQFTWQGCDSVLAAPLVLDLVRLLDLALRRGEAGACDHLALFFKSPHGQREHDLHRQFQALAEYTERLRTGDSRH